MHCIQGAAPVMLFWILTKKMEAQCKALDVAFAWRDAFSGEQEEWHLKWQMACCRDGEAYVRLFLSLSISVSFVSLVSL